VGFSPARYPPNIFTATITAALGGELPLPVKLLGSTSVPGGGIVKGVLTAPLNHLRISQIADDAQLDPTDHA